MSAKGVHNGHRVRLKERFAKSGLETFDNHQVLELLLFYAIPRKDTNELAHRLMDTFGGLPQVLEASKEDLCRVDGIGQHCASLIMFCGQLLKRYHFEKVSNITVFNNVQAMGDYLRPIFLNEKNEKSVILLVNNRWELLACETLANGTLTSTEAHARTIVETALRHRATGVVLAHNHPAGYATPSAADIQTTRRIRDALALVEVEVLDHLIFSQDDYVSMRQTPQHAPLFSAMARTLL